MPKRQFIWLMIRFMAVFWLLISLRSFVRGPLVTVGLIYMGWPWDPGVTLFPSLILGSLALGDVGTILGGLYLLFCGKTVFKLIDRASPNCCQTGLRTDDYPVILVRFAGVWWLWRAIVAGCGQIYAFAAHVVLVRALDIADPSIIKNENVRKLLEAASFARLGITLLTIVIYIILGLYFLKRAGLVIGLLQRRWLSTDTVPRTIGQASDI